VEFLPQFILQFLGSARRQLASQEFFDLARFRVEKLCQDFDVVGVTTRIWPPGISCSHPVLHTI